MAIAEPGYFHRLGIAAGEDQGVGQWLRTVLGARTLPSAMRQVHGMPFGGDRTEDSVSDESGARSELLWLGQSPLCLLIATDEVGQLGKYVARYGTGLHSVAWTIDDMWGTQIQLERQGVRVTGIDLPGRHYFLHPADTSGLLIELTDTEFTDDPRDGAALPEPETSVVQVSAIAWLTVVVTDAAKTVESLGEILALTEVKGLPRDPNSSDTVIDVRLRDIVIRFVSPQDQSSRYSAFAEKYRQRLHSACLAVPDLTQATEALAGRGVEIVSNEDGLAWTNPADTLGLSLQWVQDDALNP
jgi:hypothetical protein